jgi:hypothetical protein
MSPTAELAAEPFGVARTRVRARARHGGDGPFDVELSWPYHRSQKGA